MVQSKKTQKKYLLEQIAALKVYLGYLQKGYLITRKGLTTIGNIKQGDFNLHDDFFSSLKNVNPAIRKYSKVADIIAFQLEIVDRYKKTYKYVQSSGLYNRNEIDFIRKVFSRLITSATQDNKEL